MLARKEPKKPDDLLGLAEDSEVEQSSDSDDDERSKKLTQHRAKRRRVERIRADDDKDESDDAGDYGEEVDGATIDPRFAGKFDGPTPAPDKGDEDEGARKEVEEEADPESSKLITNPSALKPLTPAQLAQSKEATRKTGVVYLSRIPPFMKPQKVRDLLSRFGAINRIFLAPEDPKAHAKRVKFGGNKKRNFVEGWVEFVDKKLAKLCAETLNAQTVGGKKGSYYHDDVWNIKYLRKFKWHHLQAQIAYENASRQAKLRAEIAHETRVNKTYLRNVERAKMVETMQEAKKSKRKAEDGGNNDGESAEPAKVEVRRQFRQHKVKGRAAEKTEGKDQSDKVKNLLSKVF